MPAYILENKEGVGCGYFAFTVNVSGLCLFLSRLELAYCHLEGEQCIVGGYFAVAVYVAVLNSGKLVVVFSCLCKGSCPLIGVYHAL